MENLFIFLARGVTADFYKKAIENEWLIVNREEFNAISDHQNLDVRTQLTAIKKTGVRIVFLSCAAVYIQPIMKQAEALIMVKDWAWVVTVSLITYN